MIGTLQASAHARVIGHTARLAEYWSHMPSEKWESLKPEARADLAKLVEEWKTRYREELLGQMPTEKRREIEGRAATDE